MTLTVAIRACSKCGRPNDRAAMSNGRTVRWCRSCQSEGMRQYRSAGGESTPTPEARLRARARGYLNVAIRRGKLVRGKCSVCGAAQAQGHHADYTKPLDVVWLCAMCHAAEHRASRLTKQTSSR